MKSIYVLLRKILYIVNLVLNLIEPYLSPKVYPRQHAPIFIIGAPRSGSTLLYQVLVNRFQFGYLANLHSGFFGFPYVCQLIMGKWKPKDFKAAYHSRHGKVDGLWEPSECGEFWYRWFRRKPQYVAQEEADPIKLEKLKRVMAGLIQAFDVPILFKNMHCALRLRPLATIFPDAVFIVIRRDITQTAQSLLEVRRRVNGNIDQWWSMEPPTIDEIRLLLPEQQVIRQIQDIYALIEQDAAKIGTERFLTINYEELCADVYDATNRIQNFLCEHGLDVEIRGDVPASFETSKGNKLDQDTIDRLRRAMEEA